MQQAITTKKSSLAVQPVATAFYAAVVAFLTYASVYAYRKPFTIATFDGLRFWGIPYQTLLIISQVIGYMLSKFYGIRSALAVSFIFSSGFVKSVAKWLMLHANISEQWMPFVTGAVFALPMVLFIYLLEKTPPPSEEDIASRSIRLPMDKKDRARFFDRFSFGLIAVIITYFFLTIIRDIRDNFMANIWNDLGYGKAAAIFTTTEVPTTLTVLLLMSLLVLVRKNIFAFKIIHVLILLGFLVAGGSSWFFLRGQLDPVYWMTLVGLGLYTAYIPFNSIFFERLIASFKVVGNVGFIIYLADSFGYMGSVGVMLSKEIFQIKSSWAVLYPKAVVLFSAIGIAGTLISYLYFTEKYNKLKPNS